MHRTAYVITRLAGAPAIDPPEWTTARDAYAELLGSFGDVPTGLEFPEPRAWCGGDEFAATVQSELAALLMTFGTKAIEVVQNMLELSPSARSLVHGDFGPHNIMWRQNRAVGVIDWDHACIGDPAMDVAPLVGIYGARRMREVFSKELVDRAQRHRATLSLQVAAAAHRLGNWALRDHALSNFARRAESGTLYDPNGEPPLR